jgi:hypothetical protein
MGNSQSSPHPSIQSPYVNEFNKESVEKMLEGVQDDEMELDETPLTEASDEGISPEEECSIENRPGNIVPLPGIESVRGIGIYASCHGKIPNPSRFVKIPDELSFIKKNFSECGYAAYKFKRHPSMTISKIVRRLEESMDPAFQSEECAVYGFRCKKDAHGNVLNSKGNPIRLETLTCPEFNTHQTKSFLYKQYTGESDQKRVRGVFVSYGDVMVNLFTITMGELIDAFAIPQSTDHHPNLEQIQSILAQIQTCIENRDKHNFISTNFIIHISMLLHNVYTVSVVRFLDESCNVSRYYRPYFNPHGKMAFGGKSRRKKRKSRKSKKIF